MVLLNRLDHNILENLMRFDTISTRFGFVMDFSDKLVEICKKRIVIDYIDLWTLKQSNLLLWQYTVLTMKMCNRITFIYFHAFTRFYLNFLPEKSLYVFVKIFFTVSSMYEWSSLFNHGNFANTNTAAVVFIRGTYLRF